MPSADVEFASFYRAELSGQVRRAFLMLGGNEQANDVVNEAMVAVYRNWPKLETPGAYLNRAVLNGCRDAGRRRTTSVRFLHRLAGRDSTVAEADVLSAASTCRRSTEPITQVGVQVRLYRTSPPNWCARGVGIRQLGVQAWLYRASPPNWVGPAGRGRARGRVSRGSC